MSYNFPEENYSNEILHSERYEQDFTELGL